MLFKLGRSYLDRNVNNRRNKNEANEIEEDDVEVEVIEENVDAIQALQSWTTNKMRGFKRVSPASAPASRGSVSTSFNQKKSVPTKTNPVPPRSTPVSSASSPVPSPSMGPASTPPSAAENDSEKSYRGKYCHYFVNQGHCRYEERSGLKCKFEHKVAPMCNFGISCSRTKCMYSHPKVNGSNTFLGNARSPTPMMNPWQLMNPWMTPPTQFHPNPWNLQGGQNKQ